MALLDERTLMEQGLNLMKKANLQIEGPAREMYGALERQYQQVKTIKLQGKDGDHVQKVLQDSNFFCILTRLVSQAVQQSKTQEQKRANLNRVYKWYKSNIHKLHFAEQPPFRHHKEAAIKEVEKLRSARSQVSPDKENKESLLISDYLDTPKSVQTSYSLPSTPQIGVRPVNVDQVEKPTRPKSVTFRDEERYEQRNCLSPKSVSDRDSNPNRRSGHDVTSGTEPSEYMLAAEKRKKDLENMVVPVAGRATPNYNLMDTESYMDTLSRPQSVLGSAHITVVSQSPGVQQEPARPITPVVSNYIEKIQQEVNKVQGHPSDLYPEFFTTQIISALIQEMPPEEKGSLTSPDIEYKTIDQFFNMMDTYKPKVTKSISALKARNEKKLRPESVLAQRRRSDNKAKKMELSDIVNLVDVMSAEISYERQTSSQPKLNRPKTAPLQIKAPPEQPTNTPNNFSSANQPPEEVFLTALPYRPEAVPGRTDIPPRSETPLLDNTVDWRGTVTPYIQEESSQADVFKSHTFVKASNKLVNRGRSAGTQSAGNRPRTATQEARIKSSKSTVSEGQSQPPQAASNTLVEVDQSVTDEMLKIRTLSSKSNRAKSTGSHLHGQEYLDYLAAKYSVPPSSVYEYEPYPYEDDIPQTSYSFMTELSPREDNSKNGREYLSFVTSVCSDKMKIQKQRLPTPEKSEYKELLGQTTEVKDEPTPAAPSEAGDTASVSLADEMTELRQTALTPQERVKSLTQSPFFHFSSTSPTSKSTPEVKTEHRRGFIDISFQPAANTGAVDMGNKSAIIPITTRMLPPSKELLIQPVRAAPSIPSVHGDYGTRSPRNVPFSKEHERSAHRQTRPHEYLRKVSSMRGETSGEPQLPHLHKAIEVSPLRASQPEYALGELMVYNSMHLDDDIKRKKTAGPRPMSSKSISRPSTAGGRPIPQYMKADPWQKTDYETQRQREAAAAVSIQKIFRGYVARNVYLKLRTDYRVQLENKRLAAVEIQRTYRGHLARKQSIYNKPVINEETIAWARDLKLKQKQAEAERVVKLGQHREMLERLNADDKEKLSLIGPHVEVYSAYHQPVPINKDKAAISAAVTIQRWVRGHLTRKYINHLKDKASSHVSSWYDWIKYYKKFLKNVLTRRGIEKPQIEIDLKQMERFMAKKRRYEGVFDRRSFGGELDEDELNLFFKECDLMPADSEVQHAMDLIFKGKKRRSKSTLKKREVMDIVFEIYKPEGTGMASDRVSTWLNPIVDGEDAMKLMGTDLVEPAPLGPCLDLVAASLRERSEQKREAENRQILEDRRKYEQQSAIRKQSTLKTVKLDKNETVGKSETERQAKIFSDEPLYVPQDKN